MSTLLALYVLARRFATARAAVASVWLAATHPLLIYWSWGGLETTLATFLGIAFVIAVSAAMHTRRCSWLALAATMIVLVVVARPEAPFVLLCAMAMALVIDSEHRVPTLIAMMAVVLAWFGVWHFRFAYFARGFPQPVYAKSAGINGDSFRRGLRYVVETIAPDHNPVLVVLPLASLVAAVVILRRYRASSCSRPGDSAKSVTAANTIVYAASLTGFAVFGGGDWMEGGRMLVPAIAMACAFVPFGIGNTRLLRPIVIALCMLNAVGMLIFAHEDATSMPIWASTAGSAPSGYSWFEQRSRINVRDMQSADQLNRVVDDLVAHGHVPVTIMSGQMGMVPYYVARRHFGSVRFLDRNSLTDRTFIDCAATKLKPRTQLGLYFPYGTYFVQVEEIEVSCDVARPDVIYDLGISGEDVVTCNGYTTVYRQRGAVGSDDSFLPGSYVVANAFIAVRDDLTPKEVTRQVIVR